jgi:ATPase subunit of ABC transporter with duplicated ATPase domains
VQILVAHRVSKSYGATAALRPVSLRVSHGDRIGVVGPNGIGKSTLLRILAGIEQPDEGTVTRAEGSYVGYVPQEVGLRAGETLRGYLARRTGVADAEAAVEALATRLGEEAQLADAYSRALERLTLLGGEAFDARCHTVCRQLGLEAELDRPVAHVSGGNAARIRLASVLLARFDALLLDEPTNDLDFDGLARLEALVHETPSAIVLVSHDRAFLEATTRRILSFEAETGVSTEYDGGYAAFEERARADRARGEERYRRWSNEHERFSALRRDRRVEARAGGKQADRRATKAAASKVRAADRALRNLERDKVDKPWRAWELKLTLTFDERPGGTLVRLERAVARRGDFRLGPLDLTIGWRERILLTGPNGCGKSTLLAMVLGELELTAGRRAVGPRVSIASLDQGRSLFASDEPLVRVFRAASALDESEARTLLGHFNLLDDAVLRPARSLSPGERTRASLALLQARRAACLVLDEPTNHLDAEGIEQLEAALAEFPGSVLLVTHDRRMIEHFAATRTLTLTRAGIGAA